MRKLLTLLLLFPISLTAQEKYFHELKGMEDSTGTTHLFYRLNERISFQCSPDDHEDVVINAYDNIRHYNTITKSDSIKLSHFYQPWCLSGKFDAKGVNDYDFYDNDPDKWVVQETWIGCLPYPISDYSGRRFALPSVCLTKSNSYQKYDELSFLLSNAEDSLYYNDFAYENHGLRVEINDSSFYPSFESITNEEEYGMYVLYLNAVEFKYSLEAIHPTIDSIFYAISDTDYLFISERYSSNFSLADSTSQFQQLAFDATSHIIYAQVHSGIKRSNNFGRIDSWEFISLPDDLASIKFLATDAKKDGYLYISNTSYTYESKDYGNSFNLLFESEDEITGTYKKPNSDILYVLTTDELFEVNTETKAVTSIKKLPVSNEKPKETPTSIKLHQNYPNPFNPSTTISFELDRPAEVTLTIFDALGRVVSVLVDEQRTTGLHDVGFDASNHSSGIYFYRLEAGAFSETKRFTLIK